MVYVCTGLLDPRWIENQRRQLQEKKNEEAFSQGVQVFKLKCMYVYLFTCTCTCTCVHVDLGMTCVCVCVLMQVQDSLKHLAERRTDIFGVEETLIGQKVTHCIYDNV